MLKFTQSLESGDVEVKHVHMEDFSMVCVIIYHPACVALCHVLTPYLLVFQVIINVVQHYVGKVSLAIPEYNDNLETVSVYHSW